ncbi:MAG: gfo/Idh/MocA family oxidoreductase, partial [Phycisphaerales bacterium]|nr:gfo/Idh/MocA family oxidoreductase [Phycisphaerales bacterium]
EKPMTGPGQLDQARDMIKAAKDAQRRLMVAYRLRYEPFNTKCVEILRSGQLGKIRAIEAHNLQVTNAPNIRLSKSTGGGPLGDVGIYCLQAIRYLSGEEPVDVSAMQHQPTDDPRFAEVPEGVTWLTRFPSGVLATCSCGFGSQESRAFTVSCSNGTLELMNAFGYRGQELYVTKGKERSRVQVAPVDHFKAEMDAYSRAILEDKPHQTPGEEGLRDMYIMDKINEAIASGGRVKIGELPA